MQPIVADRIRLDEVADGAILSCRLRAAGLDLPAELWYRFPRELASVVSVTGDPFLPVVMLVGMKERRNVVIEADVSAELLASSRRIMDIFHTWSEQAGDGLAVVDVEAPAAARQRRGSSTGAFFSGGVDSFYTLLRNHRRYPAGDSRLITHLILIGGFDIQLEQTGLFDLTYRHANETAQALEKGLIVLKTNARAVVRKVDWGYYAHGPVLAGIGLSMSGLFHAVFIPATYSLMEMRPRGSHAAVDPLWSTEGLEFVHDGTEAGRADKVRLLATSPIALRTLRVCWENREGAYNCGQCEKCLRTMVDLLLCGVLERAERFPNRIDPEAVARLALPVYLRAFWRHSLERLKAARSEAALVRAIERALERGAWSETRLGRADYALWRRLSSWGLTPEKIKGIDARLFRGSLTSWARYLQKLAARARSG